MPLERLALSPQCGFASTLPGNLVTFDDQRAKLELLGPRRARDLGLGVPAGLELPPAQPARRRAEARRRAHGRARGLARGRGLRFAGVRDGRQPRGRRTRRRVEHRQVRGARRRDTRSPTIYPRAGRSRPARRARRATPGGARSRPSLLLVLAAPPAAAGVRADLLEEHAAIDELEVDDVTSPARGGLPDGPRGRSGALARGRLLGRRRARSAPSRSAGIPGPSCSTRTSTAGCSSPRPRTPPSSGTRCRRPALRWVSPMSGRTPSAPAGRRPALTGNGSVPNSMTCSHGTKIDG